MRRRYLASAALVVIVLGVGLVVGLSAGGSASSRAPSPTITSSGTSGTGTGTSAAASTADAGAPSTETQTAPSQPAVTVVTTPTTPADDLPGYGRPVVQLGDMNTPEQFILGQLYQLALQQEGYTVSLNRNVSIAQVALLSLKQGTLDLYPEYLDEWNTQVAGIHERFNSLAASYAAGAAYATRQHLVLLPPTPFSDTNGIAVTSQYADANHISSIGDLNKGPSIIFVAPLGFTTNAHGLPAVEHAYGLHPGYVQVVNTLGSQYTWLAEGNAQAAYVMTTDPQLVGPQYRLLSDPLHVFGFGNVVPITTPKVLKAEGPAFLQTIERIDAALTTSAMRGLNWEVEEAGHDATEVASEFLQGQGITPPVVFAPVPTTTTETATSTTGTTTSAAPLGG